MQNVSTVCVQRKSLSEYGIVFLFLLEVTVHVPKD